MRATRHRLTIAGRGLVLAGAGLVALGAGQGVAVAQTGTAQVSGVVFHDLDGDGTRQPSEPGIGGVGIQLQDSTGDFLASTSTSENGSYSFSGLEPDAYRVAQVANAPGYSEDTTPNMIVLNVSGDETDVDFGDARAEGESDSTVSLDGRVWVDADRDGEHDPGERGATEVRVLIADDEYDPVIWLRPDADATLTWEGDAGGRVVIRALPPDGWVGTTELVAYAEPGGSGEFHFGVAPPQAPTTTTAPTTPTPPPGDPAPPGPGTGAPGPGDGGADGTGDGTAPPPGAQGPAPDPDAPPPPTTTPPAANVPIDAALAPVPGDPTPRRPTTTVSVEVAGAQATRRLASTGQGSSGQASSGAALVVGGVLTVLAGSALRRRSAEWASGGSASRAPGRG